MGIGAIKSFKDLEVWVTARGLVKDVYLASGALPKEEMYGLTSQMRRSAVSVPANIAEGHSRRSTKDFINFLSISIGSLAELETYICVAVDLEYFSPKQLEHITGKIERLQRQLHNLRSALRKKDDTLIPNPQSPIPLKRVK